MTEIIESTSKMLNIIYRRGLVYRIAYSAMAIGFLGFAAALLIWGGKPGEDAKYPEFAPIASVLIGILMLAIGSFFLVQVLDATNYYFDKTATNFISQAGEICSENGKSKARSATLPACRMKSTVRTKTRAAKFF